jgi:hypothetical protein
MIASDSRTQTVKCNFPTYLTSEPRDSEWGQPAASNYFFMVDGNRLRGQLIADAYLPSLSYGIPVVEPDLATELEAWDAASDEALADFEATLD